MVPRSLVLAGLLVLALPLCAFAQSPPHPLFLNSQEITGKVGSAATVVHVDESVFGANALSEGDRLSVMTPEGAAVVDLRRSTTYLDGTWSLTGGSGSDAVAVTYSRGAVAGVVHAAGVHYRLRTEAQSGLTLLERIDPDHHDHLGCGIAALEYPAIPVISPAMEGAAKSTTGLNAGTMVNASTLASGTHDPITLDLMMVYTVRADEWAETQFGEGGMALAIAQAMALSQLALDNSQVNVALRLVHVHETAYSEADVSSSVSLQRLTASSTFNPWGEVAAGYMEEIHTLRDQYGADLVAMLAFVDDTGGIAWLLGSVAGRPEMGFSLNRIQQVTFTYTLVHEIAHNMGSMHSRDQGTQAAAPFGGIFPYSVGWRFNGVFGEEARSYATIMTYQEGRSHAAPHFSSPSISFMTGATGAYDGPFAPADNARSLREIKRVVARYRPTRVDPPAPVVQNAIGVTVAPGRTATVTVPIANTGTSDLVWEAEYGWQAAGKTLPFSEGTPFDAAPFSEATVDAPSTNLPPSTYLPGAAIYETSFETQDGMLTGLQQYANMWVAAPGSSFTISNENPDSGTQHLRVESIGRNQVDVYSPRFGPFGMGAYEFSMDIAISQTGGCNYFLVFEDSRGSGSTAEIVFASNGLYYIRGINPSTGQPGFLALASWTWTPGAYFNLRVSLDPDGRSVDYFIDDELVVSRPYISGFSIGRLRIIRQVPNNTVDKADYIDIDNVAYRFIREGFTWFNAPSLSGVVAPGANAGLVLNFDAGSRLPGTYTASITLTTNEIGGQRVLPVTMTVDSAVSAEEGEIPTGYFLAGNYPNPFNPSTSLQYGLGKAGHVRLDVYNVKGQLVERVVDEWQPAGTHQRSFDASHLAGGVYLYRLTSGTYTATGRMVLLK
jgi:hypothetical protein